MRQNHIAKFRIMSIIIVQICLRVLSIKEKNGKKFNFGILQFFAVYPFIYKTLIKQIYFVQDFIIFPLRFVTQKQKLIIFEAIKALNFLGQLCKIYIKSKRAQWEFGLYKICIVFQTKWIYLWWPKIIIYISWTFISNTVESQ